MKSIKNIVAISGSASKNSSNEKIIHHIAALTKTDFNFTIYTDLAAFPAFRTELTSENTPKSIVEFREKIKNADGIVICTPEYVFSIPSGLKNVIEWCVSTTVFTKKPIGLITASASGLKGHEELKLIMKTVETVFTKDTSLLIQGIKGKVNQNGIITDNETELILNNFVKSFKNLVLATWTYSLFFLNRKTYKHRDV